MKLSASKTSLLCCLGSLVSVSALVTGCSLSGTAPGVPITTPVGNIHGNVHGGRQPVVGANVYLYQPSTTGYGGVNIAATSLNASTSILSNKVPSACGAGATASATVAGGVITAINVVTGGAGYVSGGSALPPTVTITDSTGTGASATATLSTYNAVSGFNLVSGGTGYTAPTVTITPASTSACSDASGNYYISSDANGNFSLTGDYTCSANVPVYVYALGGDAGSGVSPDAGFLAVLGICPASGTLAGQVPAIYVNELSTVAAAYATAGFATNPTHIGVLVQQTAPSSLTSSLASLQALETTGLNNAFLTAGNLYAATSSADSATASTPGGNGKVPYQTINVLGNILAGCVNSGPGVGSYCTSLLGYTPGATDTAGAALYIAQHPATNVSSLFSLASGVGSPWIPALSTKPNDWTLSISYTVPGAGIGLYSSHQVAVDGSGNVWVTGQNSFNEIAAVNNLGVPLAGSPYSGNGLNAPVDIAVDAASANVWVPNESGNSVSVFTTAGAAVQTFTPYSTGTTDALNAPDDVVFDSAGNIWLNNYTGGTTSALVELSSAGAYTATGSNTTYMKSGEGIAAAANGTLFATSYTDKYVSLWNANDTLSTELGTSNYSLGVAVDAGGNAWAANYEKYVYKVNSTATSSTRITANSTIYYVPEFYSVAIDGAGNVWLPDWANGVIEELNNSGTVVSGTYGYEPAETVSYTPSGSTKPTTGYYEVYNIAVDPSGNVWTNSVAAANILQEMVGVATPVVTPLAYGVKNSLLGTAP